MKDFVLMLLALHGVGIPLGGLQAQMAGPPGSGLEVDPGLVGEHAPAGEGLPLYRPAGSVAVLAVATEEWLPVPTHSRELKGNYQFIPDQVARAARGQRFELLEAEGDWDLTRGRGATSRRRERSGARTRRRWGGPGKNRGRRVLRRSG